MKPDERGFEDAITGSPVEAGGYRICTWGTKPVDSLGSPPSSTLLRLARIHPRRRARSTSTSATRLPDNNADIFGQILDNPTFKNLVMDHYLQRVFERARLPGPEASPIPSP